MESPAFTRSRPERPKRTLARSPAIHFVTFRESDPLKTRTKRKRPRSRPRPKPARERPRSIRLPIFESDSLPPFVSPSPSPFPFASPPPFTSPSPSPFPPPPRFPFASPFAPPSLPHCSFEAQLFRLFEPPAWTVGLRLAYIPKDCRSDARALHEIAVVLLRQCNGRAAAERRRQTALPNGDGKSRRSRTEARRNRPRLSRTRRSS